MKIAVYGRIGAGKSTVAKLLAEMMDVSLISADQVVRDLYPILSNQLNDVFGTDERKEIAKIVFSNKQALTKLNAIFAEPLIKRMDELLEKSSSLVIEAPLLLEYGIENRFDFLICVTASVEVRIKRLMETRQLTLEEAQARIDSQEPQTFATDRITTVISNDGALTTLASQVRQLLRYIDTN